MTVLVFQRNSNYAQYGGYGLLLGSKSTLRFSQLFSLVFLKLRLMTGIKKSTKVIVLDFEGKLISW